MSSTKSTLVIILLVGIIAFLSWKILSEAQPMPLGSSETPRPTEPVPTPVPAPSIDPNAPLSSRVNVTTPAKRATVKRSFDIAGSAPGNWYFEASFPIQVRDANNAVIGRAVARAEGDWMTEKLVPFKATVTLDAGYSGTADLILLRDNPSGLPENDDSVTIPIVVE